MARKGQQTEVASDKSYTVAQLPRACSDELAAVEFIERQRWGETPCCVHCGSVNVYKMADAATGQRNKRFLWRCRDCKQQYTVRIGTVFEDSRIPLKYWCYAFWAACSSKKGVSALQIKRMTGVTYKSALFMMHRIRYAMSDNAPNPPKLEGTVEVDETYIGGKRRYARNPAIEGKMDRFAPVVAMVQRGGDVRARHIDWVTTANLRRTILENVNSDNSRLMTDQLQAYRTIGRPFKKGHFRVFHSGGEYVNPENRQIHSNTAESFFAILKRGINGVYHQVSKHHLHRYLDEFAFRWNTRHVDDGERTAKAIKKAEGKRLTYKSPLRKSA